MSVFKYGCETWTTNEDIENKINRFEIWIFRKVTNVKWSDKVTNEDVCLKFKVERTLLKTIKRRKLSYFGHIKRLHAIKKEMLGVKVNEIRGRSRPEDVGKMMFRRRWSFPSAPEQ